MIVGMIDVGFGEMYVNSLLFVMNILIILFKSIKCREREIVFYLVDMVEEICRKSLEEEVRLYVYYWVNFLRFVWIKY